jgi:hypothetical protein
VVVDITFKVEVSTKECGKNHSLCPLTMSLLNVTKLTLKILQAELRETVNGEEGQFVSAMCSISCLLVMNPSGII